MEDSGGAQQARRSVAESKSYIITAWIEGSEWRYELRHVQSAESRYFAHLEDVANYLKADTGIALLPEKTRR